jgi:hypothetical protein
VINTNIPPTLYPRRGSRGISDIPPRCSRFTKITYLWGIFRRDRWYAHRSLSQVKVLSFTRLLRHTWKKERGAIFFCPGHHTRQRHTRTRDLINVTWFYFADLSSHVTLNYPVHSKVVWKRSVISDKTTHCIFLNYCYQMYFTLVCTIKNNLSIVHGLVFLTVRILRFSQ